MNMFTVVFLFLSCGVGLASKSQTDCNPVFNNLQVPTATIWDTASDDVSPRMDDSTLVLKFTENKAFEPYWLNMSTAPDIVLLDADGVDSEQACFDLFVWGNDGDSSNDCNRQINANVPLADMMDQCKYNVVGNSDSFVVLFQLGFKTHRNITLPDLDPSSGNITKVQSVQRMLPIALELPKSVDVAATNVEAFYASSHRVYEISITVLCSTSTAGILADLAIVFPSDWNVTMMTNDTVSDGVCKLYFNVAPEFEGQSPELDEVNVIDYCGNIVTIFSGGDSGYDGYSCVLHSEMFAVKGIVEQSVGAISLTDATKFNVNATIKLFTSVNYPFELTAGEHMVVKDGFVFSPIRAFSKEGCNSTANPDCDQVWEWEITGNITGLGDTCALDFTGNYAIQFNAACTASYSAGNFCPIKNGHHVVTIRFSLDSGSACPKLVSGISVTATLEAFQDFDRTIAANATVNNEWMYFTSSVSSDQIGLVSANWMSIKVDNNDAYVADILSDGAVTVAGSALSLDITDSQVVTAGTSPGSLAADGFLTPSFRFFFNATELQLTIGGSEVVTVSGVLEMTYLIDGVTTTTRRLLAVNQDVSGRALMAEQQVPVRTQLTVTSPMPVPTYTENFGNSGHAVGPSITAAALISFFCMA